MKQSVVSIFNREWDFATQSQCRWIWVYWDTGREDCNKIHTELNWEGQRGEERMSTNRDRWLIQADSVATELREIWNEKGLMQHLPMSRVTQGPVNKLGWGHRNIWKGKLKASILSCPWGSLIFSSSSSSLPWGHISSNRNFQQDCVSVAPSSSYLLH